MAISTVCRWRWRALCSVDGAVDADARLHGDPVGQRAGDWAGFRRLLQPLAVRLAQVSC